MSGKVINVLLVEDNPTDALLVRTTLAATREAAFAVTHASYLEDAIQLCASQEFDVILLDLGLPDSQDLATFERAHAALSGIPILILSGLGDDKVAMRAVEEGAQDYLPKCGVLEGQLPRAIRYSIERHRGQMELRRYAAELERKNRELEDELTMARDIQQALLPHHYPRFAAHHSELNFAHFYRPAAALSGDFFNVLHLSDNQAGVLICDVMGHGVRAALIGTLARGLMDQFMPVASQPGEFLTALNGEFADTFKKGGIDAFVTAFYFVADLEERRITYANAGHPNALVRHRGNGTVDWLRANGDRKPPLGMVGQIRYPSFESTLSEEDSILLFTDGLFEAENSVGELYGRQRLREAVGRHMDMPCKSLIDELVHETQEFAGREDFTDDVCLVGMDVVKGGAPFEHAA
ncbi:MAG: SpoIIE family protein phosphatase [Luteolibacter sp.]